MRRLSPYPGLLVTVVVTLTDDDQELVERSLESLLNQRHRNVDVLVVGYGQSERVLGAARCYAARDWRVRISRGVCQDKSAARNVGAASAFGEFLAFLDCGDTMPPRALSRLVAALVRSGSTFAAGAVTNSSEVVSSERRRTTRERTPHATAATLEQHPSAITDLMVKNRLFRRKFWREAGLRFEPGPDPETDVALAAFAEAPSFDLLNLRVCHVHGGRAGDAIGSVPDRLAKFDETFEHLTACWRGVRSLGVPAAEQAWLALTLNHTVQPLFDTIEAASPAQFDQLREGLGTFFDAVDDVEPFKLAAEPRVKLWLLSRDRRRSLEEFVAGRWYEYGNVATEVRETRILARLPFFGDEAVGVPTDCFELSVGETPLVAMIRGAGWTEDGMLSLEVFARIRLLGMADYPQVSARLVETHVGTTVPVEVQPRRDVGANQVQGARHQDYSHGAMTLIIDPDAVVVESLHNDSGGESLWELELTMTVAGVTRSGGLTVVAEEGSAGALGTGHVPARRSGESMVGLTRNFENITVVRVRRRVGAELLTLQLNGRQATLTLNPDEHDVVSLQAQAGPDIVSAPIRRTEGGLQAELMLPEVTETRRDVHWQVRAVTADDAELPILWPAKAGQWINSADATLAGHRTQDGHLNLVEAGDTLVADRIELIDGDVRLAGHWLGTPAEQPRLRLVGAKVGVDGRPDTGVSEGNLVVSFRMEHDEWGLGATPAPADRYRVQLSCGPGDARRGRVLLSAHLMDRLLETEVDSTYRLGLVRYGREAGIVLSAPLTDDERGPFARQSLIEWSQSGEIPFDTGAVYFQSYLGTSATDSPLAIHDELRRRKPAMTTYWGVADRSSTLPAGATPVIIGSREYYRVLGSAGHIVVNVDLERRFSRRPGQRVLQTFHGYPAKSMGIRLWQAKGYTPLRIEAELRRTSGDWDMILTPSPEMDEHYRREYAYDGHIHSAGYPRDDVLVSAEAERIRDEARARLGIRPGQTAVLHAPTWRDDLATNWKSAKLARHLDLEAASRQLGPDYVLLMRGHRFHEAIEDRSESNPCLLDVTDYPEINDLILAADAAVLDYSSLRFDFALTGRPVIFLVPDLATYTGAVRGFLFDFAESAPGPLVETADEVVRLLSDLPALEAEWADKVSRFNDRFNSFQDGGAAARVVDAFVDQ
ncbi:MAG: bifunctional glycosyltransferase family 2 protein/CDP-glycerol:glycerophosphate glycerophosphotransferase [Nocardioides sp.]|nr:bifunctional glycosyltransferase family 2 protein/CDP-glycerol:glycerophosphate glycerophosphotransferase [Nocardioides sp.]